MKQLRTLVAVIVVALFATLAFQVSGIRSAQATTTAPDQPVLSAKSAALPMQANGVVALASVGRVSEAARVEFREAAAVSMAGRMARPSQTGSATNGTVQAMCNTAGQVVAQGLTLGISSIGSGVIGNLCTAVVSTVLQWVGNLLKGVLSFISNLVASAARWAIQTSIDLSTGYNDRCQTTANGGSAGFNPEGSKCNGDEARSRVLGVAGTTTYATIAKLSVLLAFPILIVAAITAMFKQSFDELGQALIRLPFIWIIAIVAIFLVAAAVGLRDLVGNFLIASTDLKGNINTFFTDNFGTNASTGAQLAVAHTGAGSLIMLISFLVAFFGGLLLFLIFLVSDMVILASVAFMPLATVGLLWGGTAKWFKRIIELMGAFIIGKVVVIAMLCLSFELLV
jgi:hypothetical protein